MVDFSTGENALAAILHEILCTHPDESLIRQALPAFHAHGERLKHDFDELWRILLAIAQDPRSNQLTWVVDGLDECEDQSRRYFLSQLVELYKQPTKYSCRLKILISSRRYDSIHDSFEELKTIAEFEEIDSSLYTVQIAKDVDEALETEVQQLFKARKPEVQKCVLRYLRESDNKTYLWLYLMLEQLRTKSKADISKIEQVFQNPPKTLAEAYQSILDEVSANQDTELALDILKLVLAAERPLTLQEINIAHHLKSSSEIPEGDDLDLDLWEADRLRRSLRTPAVYLFKSSMPKFTYCMQARGNFY